jgi:hypothetical protein
MKKQHLGSLRGRCVGVMTRKTWTRDILRIPAYVNHFFSLSGVIVFSVLWGPFGRYSFVRPTQYHNTCHPTYFYQWVKSSRLIYHKYQGPDFGTHSQTLISSLACHLLQEDFRKWRQHG